MPETSPNLILYPVFAMFLLVAVVLVRLARMRVAAIGKREVSITFYRTYQEGEEPEHVRVVTRHFINLFEMPVLFYVGVILVYIAHQVNVWMICLAWAYVGARYVHTYVHLTSNDVLLRFRIYLASGLILIVMWSSLFVQVLRAG